MYVLHRACGILPLDNAPDEKNERSKELIKKKIDEYLGRAETLKEHTQSGEEKKARRAIGANGMSNGGNGGSGKA